MMENSTFLRTGRTRWQMEVGWSTGNGVCASTAGYDAGAVVNGRRGS